MAVLTVTGASDDLIEIGGTDICDEFNVMEPDDDDPVYIAVSDGTLLRVIYDNDGIWRITLVARGAAAFIKTEGDVQADTNDKVELRLPTGSFTWAVCGDSKALPQK